MKWTKELPKEAGVYNVAYSFGLNGERGFFCYAWLLRAGDQFEVKGDGWRSVDPITPPSEEKP